MRFPAVRFVTEGWRHRVDLFDPGLFFSPENALIFVCGAWEKAGRVDIDFSGALFIVIHTENVANPVRILCIRVRAQTYRSTRKYTNIVWVKHPLTVAAPTSLQGSETSNLRRVLQHEAHIPKNNTDWLEL